MQHLTQLTSADIHQPAYDVLVPAASRAGVNHHGAELIRDGSNVLYRLANGIVARIGSPGSTATAAKEVRVSAWLRSNGIRAVQVAPDLDQSIEIHERPVTFWELLADHRPSTPAELGAVLRRLHALPVPDLRLPTLNPFAGLAETIETASVPAADRSFLRHNLDHLRQAFLTCQTHLATVLHGDAWQGNYVVPSGRQPTLLDFEAFSVGPSEWDLISLAADYADFSRLSADEYAAFAEAYGSDVTRSPSFRTLASIQELRWTCFALRKAATNPQLRDQALHRIACLRGDIPRPWSWSAH